MTLTRDELKEAFIAGFSSTREGLNGECFFKYEVCEKGDDGAFLAYTGRYMRPRRLVDWLEQAFTEWEQEREQA